MDARYAKFAPWMAAVVTLFTFGCNSSELEKTRDSAMHEDASAPAPRRECSFEMVGFACNDPESPLSSKQAAIIESFCSALIEGRRCRGESATDFTMQVGERLTFTYRGTPENHELQLVLKSEGRRIKFEVTNGVLQSRIQDFEILQQLFDETGGELALLSLEPAEDKDGFVARVGCFVEQEPGVLLAGDIDPHGDDIAP